MGEITISNTIGFLIVILLMVSIYYLINIGNKYVDQNDMIVLTRKNIIRAVLIIVSLVLVYVIFRKVPIIPTTLVTVFIGIIVAYIINPMVVYFEKRGLNRILSIVVVYVIIIGLFAILLGIVIPKTISEFKNLILALPNIVEQAEVQLARISENLLKGNQLMDGIGKNFTSDFTEFVKKLQTSFFLWLSSLADKVPNYFSTMLRIVLVPVVSFYILIDKEKLINRAKRRIPKKYKKETISLLKDIDITLTDFVRGRLLMAVFVGVATAICLLILKVDFAIVVGIVTTIADIVPYIGPFLGFLPAVILAAIQSPVKAVWVAVIFVLLQWLENNIIGPKILGQSVGLHPLIVLLSLIVGGGIAGVAGMIFSVPIVATLNVIFKHLGPFIKDYLKKLVQD
ncbi:MAG: AI-2E family transporter [Tissierellia bacterium]|nr:AI-2E family transporter [Tissierellia bacterium]